MTRQHGPRPDAMPLTPPTLVTVCVFVLLALWAGFTTLAWWTTPRDPEPVAAQHEPHPVDDDWSCPTCDDADPRCPEWEAKR